MPGSIGGSYSNIYSSHRNQPRKKALTPDEQLFDRFKQLSPNSWTVRTEGMSLEEKIRKANQLQHQSELQKKRQEQEIDRNLQQRLKQLNPNSWFAQTEGMTLEEKSKHIQKLQRQLAAQQQKSNPTQPDHSKKSTTQTDSISTKLRNFDRKYLEGHQDDKISRVSKIFKKLADQMEANQNNPEKMRELKQKGFELVAFTKKLLKRPKTT